MMSRDKNSQAYANQVGSRFLSQLLCMREQQQFRSKSSVQGEKL